jgi:iron complex outermembrane receptor protein
VKALFRVGFCLLLCLALLPGAAFAQASIISGRVIDPDGAVVTGATVTLTDIQSGNQITTNTIQEGTYRFVDVRPGRYLVQIMASGFGMYSEDIEITTGNRTLDASLQLAGVTEAVTVQGIATNPSIGRTAVPLKDQPITVNRITAEQLQAQGVNDMVTALQFVNNVNAYQSYGVSESYQFRGFPDMVQMVDGIRNEGNKVRSQLSNVESIEVLKGPASVLYGSDSLGATMNIVLKKPSAQPAYDFSTSAGSWNTYRASAGATGRIAGSARTLYRIDAGIEDADNFRHDAWNRLNVTPSLLFRVSPRDELDVRYALNRNHLSGDPGIPLVTRPDGSTFIADVPRSRRFSTPQDFADSDDHNIRGSWGHTFGNGMGVRNITGYRVYNDEYWETETLRVVYPSTVTRQFLYFFHHRRPLTNQVEFSGPVKALVNHDLLMGWDYQWYRTRTTRVDSASVLTTPIDLYNPVETHVTRTEFPPTRQDYTTNYTNGLYLQDHVTLSNTLKAVVGLRLDAVRRYQHNNPVVNGVETEVAQVRRVSKKPTERVGLVYQPRTNVDVYGQFATAFQPNFNLQPDGTPLEPTFGTSYEVGNRLRLMRDRVSINTAIFNITKRNVAFSRPGGFFEQVGKVRSRGFEADLNARLSPALQLVLGYGYTDAVYLDYITAVTTTAVTDFSGNRPPRVPPHTVSAQAIYSWNNTLSVMAGTQFRDKQFLNDQNTLFLDNFQIANVAATYYRGPMQVNFTVSNLTDTFYYSSIRGNTQFYPGEPRRYQATLRWNIK